MIQNYYLIHSPYSDFASFPCKCPSYFFSPGPGSNPETWLAFSCYIYSVSLNLEYFLRLSLSFLKLRVLKSIGWFFKKINLQFFGVCVFGLSASSSSLDSGVHFWQEYHTHDAPSLLHHIRRHMTLAWTIIGDITLFPWLRKWSVGFSLLFFFQQ